MSFYGTTMTDMAKQSKGLAELCGRFTRELSSLAILVEPSSRVKRAAEEIAEEFKGVNSRAYALAEDLGHRDEEERS